VTRSNERWRRRYRSVDRGRYPQASLSPLEISRGANGNPDEFWYQAEKEIIKANAELGDVPPGMTDNLPV
jgi:hypothetical protein